MSEPQPGSARLVITLAVAGLLSGLVLVGVFLWAQPRILRNQAEALRAAILRVLPGATEVETWVVRGDGLVAYEGGEGSIPQQPAVYSGRTADGDLVGYAIPADGPGFMDTIKLIYGYDPGRRVIVGMQVLDSRETPGLGDKIITDAAFHENFRQLEVDPAIEPVKKGRKTAANQVDCITGATISSEAVVGILNKSAQKLTPVLQPAAPSEVSRNARR